jgi:hypothetical protein
MRPAAATRRSRSRTGAFLDPTAPFGVAHTNGLAWLVGGFGVFCDCAGAWPVAPRTPCSPGQVLQTNNPGGVCVTAWICSFFRCNLTRQWRCDPGGAAWTLLAQWTGGCP